MKNIRFFYLKNCHFWVVKFSVYLNRRVFVMLNGYCKAKQILTRLAMQMRKKLFFYLSIYFILFIYLFFFCFYFLQSAKACKRLFLIARSKFWSWLIEKKKKSKNAVAVRYSLA